MKMKKILSALLSAAVVLSLTACGGDAETTTTATTTTIDDDIENPVDVSDIELDTGLKEDVKIEPCTLTYIGNYDMTKAGDIKPAVKYFESTYGCEIEVSIVGYNQLEEKILLLIQG
ncbi:MAG: carbohydrate ABC transporter substrate-binding protein, CUT1 family, partial [Ruminiclostridium sp.]